MYVLQSCSTLLSSQLCNRNHSHTLCPPSFTLMPVIHMLLVSVSVFLSLPPSFLSALPSLTPLAQGKGDLQITTLFKAKCITQMEKLLSDIRGMHAHTHMHACMDAGCSVRLDIPV